MSKRNGSMDHCPTCGQPLRVKTPWGAFAQIVAFMLALTIIAGAICGVGIATAKWIVDLLS